MRARSIGLSIVLLLVVGSVYCWAGFIATADELDTSNFEEESWRAMVIGRVAWRYVERVP